VFENLAKHRKILVTGPHRSGTTIAATMIHDDLKSSHGLVLEELCWKPERCLDAVKMWLEINEPMIIQAPFAADVCHQFPGVFVVFMHRDIDAIENSQKRMKLRNGRKVWWHDIEATERDKYHCDDSTVAGMKYRCWQDQKQHIVNYLELDYETLKDHHLWIQPELRKDFHVRQTYAVG